MSRAQKDGDTCQYYVHESDALEGISIAEEEMKKKAIEAFRQFVQYCAESGRKDISEDSEHYVNVFNELINA